jgi:two-component system chemotaxis response regulator CheY
LKSEKREKIYKKFAIMLRQFFGGMMLNIMIADGSQVAREATVKSIVELGHIVVAQAIDGLDTIQKYKKLRPDLLLLEVNLSKLDGIKVLQTIKMHYHSAVVVMLTSIADDKIVKECIKSGAYGYMLKPVSTQKMSEVAKKLLGEVPKSHQV